MNIYSFIKIDENSLTAKYLQICNCIRESIISKAIPENYILPSINDLSYELDVSRDVAERSYRALKSAGVIGAIHGKGYFVLSAAIEKKKRICLLFNTLSDRKKIIYEAFTAGIGNDYFIDFYIYNNNVYLFKKIIESGHYDYYRYVIIPHFNESHNAALSVLCKIPSKKLLFLSKDFPGISSAYGAIYEDFASDVYNALKLLNEQLCKYVRIGIVFPEHSYYPSEILTGVKIFCDEFAYDYEVLSCIESSTINNNTAYILIRETDLVDIIELAMIKGYKVGSDIGLISYNETPVKGLILGGITTISTDFKLMGDLAADFIRNGTNRKHKLPFFIKIRQSV